MSPSLRFTTRYLFGDMPTSRTEYICGHNTRSESRNCAGHSSTTPPTNVQYKCGPWVVYIHNRDLGYSFWIDMERGIYAAYRANEFGSPAWAKPRISPLKPSGKTVHVRTDTIDTGERKSVFGSTARRLITRSRQLRDSELESESECDGWYIDAPAAWVNLHPPNARTFCVLSCTSDGTRDEFKFTETGTRETGFLVQARHTHRSFFQDDTGSQRTHETASQQEVTELSESPLESRLFVPARDFRRVPHLPDRVRHTPAFWMRLHWEMLKDSFRLRSKIDGFTAVDVH